MTAHTIQFKSLENASLTAEWFFFIIGVIFLIISVFGNGYVSYRLIKIVRVSKAIQTPIYLSLTVCGFCTGVFCMPYMLYTLYFDRIDALVGLLYQTPEYQSNFSTTATPMPLPTSSFNFSSYSYSWKTTTGTPNCADPISQMKMFDRVFCNLTGTVFNITSRLIIWLMLLLSIDRYIFICKPYRIHLVKKQHYAIWIMTCSVIIIALSFAPFIFYFPEAVSKMRAKKCPQLAYQPYRKTYSSCYTCDYDSLILLNISVHQEAKSSFEGLIVFFVFAVILLNLIPIFLNVAFSVKVFFEILKMRRMTRMTSMTAARGDYTYVTKCDDMELEDLSRSTCTPNLYNQFRSFSIVSQKRSSIPNVSARLAKQMQGVLRWFKYGSVIENKASFTMLVLSLFYIVTYFAWVLVWVSSLLALINLERHYAGKSPVYINLYHSTSSVAYNIMNHYPMATFANAAFVPCLLGYSLHRGKS